MTGGGADRVRAGLESLAALAARVAAEQADAIAAIADRYEAVLRSGGTLFVFRLFAPNASQQFRGGAGRGR